MTTNTTNNEPLGGDDLPISMSTYGSLEECEKERARRASQQSGAAGASDWLEQFETLLDDYVGAAQETAVFNVTQRSGMTVRMAKPRHQKLMAHVRALTATGAKPTDTGAAGVSDLANEIQAELASETLNIGIQQSLLRRAAAEIANLRTQFAALDTDKVRLTRELALAEEGAAHWKAKHDAQLARQRQGQAVHFVKSAIHPKGWHECDAADLEGHARAGFATRTLYTAAPVQGEPVAPAAQPTDEHEFIYFTAVSVNGELLWREVDAATWSQAKGVLKRTTYVGPYRLDLSAPQADEVRDSERLDWLEANHAQTYRFESTGHWRISDVFAPLGQGETLREAIDAARTTAADNQKGAADA